MHSRYFRPSYNINKPAFYLSDLSKEETAEEAGLILSRDKSKNNKAKKDSSGEPPRTVAIYQR